MHIHVHHFVEGTYCMQDSWPAFVSMQGSSTHCKGQGGAFIQLVNDSVYILEVSVICP